jgi:hypothetical protein
LLEEKPETLLIQEIEALFAPISLRDDWAAFEQKIERIRAFRGLYKGQANIRHII